MKPPKMTGKSQTPVKIIQGNDCLSRKKHSPLRPDINTQRQNKTIDDFYHTYYVQFELVNHSYYSNSNTKDKDFSLSCWRFFKRVHIKKNTRVWKMASNNPPNRLMERLSGALVDAVARNVLDALTPPRPRNSRYVKSNTDFFLKF